MSPSVRAELLRLQRALASHGREPTGHCAVPGAVTRLRRHNAAAFASTQTHRKVRALAAVVRAYAKTGTYASPSLSRPLLRLTDGMSSMCRFPGSYVLCCAGGARAWAGGGGPPPRPRPPLLGNPLLPRGFDIVCCVFASVVYLPFHPLSLCGPPNFTRGTIPSTLSLLPSRRK